MAPRDNVQAVLSRVGKQEWFFQRLLGETLEWPVGADRDVDDLSHGRLKTFARPILNVKLSRAASGRFSHSLTASLGESLPWNSSKKLTENVAEGGVPYVERRVRLPRFCRLSELVIVEQATVQEGNIK